MINVIGMGYIGLPTALELAANGLQVIGTDYNSAVINSLKAGVITFSEDGLPALFAKAQQNNIEFSTQYHKMNFYIVAVPTPYDKVTKKIDMQYVVGAVRKILEVCEKDTVIVIESTVSPGSIDTFLRPMLKDYAKADGQDVHFAHAPERIIPGNMLHELRHNSRTIGADNEQIAERIKKVYASFCEGEIVLTNIRTAEMTKVIENTYRDINIAFANELAKICRHANMDVYEIIRIANKHPRVNVMQPGPGVGGHCIPVDPWFLVGDYPRLANLILTARTINDSMPAFVLERLHEIMQQHGINDIDRVGIYGLTYKEDVDDVRESPTLQMFEQMKKHLAPSLKVYDPYVLTDIVPKQYHDLESFLRDIDIVVLMVGHSELRNNLGKLAGKIILDTRNICPGMDDLYTL